jgi:hypothetical protein
MEEDKLEFPKKLFVQISTEDIYDDGSDDEHFLAESGLESMEDGKVAIYKFEKFVNKKMIATFG